jgi:hypothetical protein
VADGCLWGLGPQSGPSLISQLIHRLLSANIGNRGSGQEPTVICRTHRAKAAIRRVSSCTMGCARTWVKLPQRAATARSVNNWDIKCEVIAWRAPKVYHLDALVAVRSNSPVQPNSRYPPLLCTKRTAWMRREPIALDLLKPLTDVGV